MAEKFGDWRDEFKELAVSMYVDVWKQHEPVLAVLRETDPEMAVEVMRRAYETIGPIVADEFELRFKQAIADGWTSPALAICDPAAREAFRRQMRKALAKNVRLWPR